MYRCNCVGVYKGLTAGPRPAQNSALLQSQFPLKLADEKTATNRTAAETAAANYNVVAK